MPRQPAPRNRIPELPIKSGDSHYPTDKLDCNSRPIAALSVDQNRMTKTLVQNFGKNVSFTPAIFAEPKDEHEVIELLRQHRGKSVRVMASRHAWSDAIKTDGLLISTRHLTQVKLNPDHQSVRVGAGCKIKHLLKFLKKHGLTLPSVGLIDEQTIAGATATGTHGSGKHSLSHYIRSVRLAHYQAATGEPVFSELDSGAELRAARCSLGLLGVIVEIEIEVRPSYQIEEHMKRHASLASILESETQYPLQQFFVMPWSWDFYCQHRRETPAETSRTALLYRTYWHLGIDWLLHLALLLLAKFMGIPRLIRGFYRLVLPRTIIRNWIVTDDSHAILTMDHDLFRHIEIELFVSRSNLEAALNHVRETITVFGDGATHEQNRNLMPENLMPENDRGNYCHHYPICVRRIRADDTLISMASPATPNSKEDWYSISLISFHWPHLRSGFFAFANSLAGSMQKKFNARCHWGKFNPLDKSANIHLYPHLEEFREIAERYDGQARFANRWLKKAILDNDSTDS